MGFDLLSTLRLCGVSFLASASAGMRRLLRNLGYYRREDKHTVYLWPNAMHDREPLVLRHPRRLVHLVTDAIDPRTLQKHGLELYRRRWGWRWQLPLAQAGNSSVASPPAHPHARIRLAWVKITGLWTLTLLGVAAIRAADHPTASEQRGATLAGVRHAMHSQCSDLARPCKRTPAAVPHR